jgi:hypothetical protein
MQTFAQHQIHTKILHRRVEELFDHARQTVDFVNEQDRAFFSVGEVGHQIGRFRQGRAGGHLDRGAQFVRNDRSKRGFAEARRAIEQNMRERLAQFFAGVDGDAETFHYRFLADDFAQPSWT